MPRQPNERLKLKPHMRAVLQFCFVGSLALLVTGCPFPHTHLKQPHATFVARGPEGPIPTAHLSLYAGNVVGSSVQTRFDVDANAEGVMVVPNRHEWHWFVVPIPDAEAPWVWAWCVSAPGYTAAKGRLDQEPRDTVHVRLVPGAGAAASCPTNPRSLYDVALPSE